ncbi:MAG: hypothetical protein IT561_04240 [Alphaproteobacteria bacterium]|nr:hypothetical protein [Alphaproteobacteria bacterium]
MATYTIGWAWGSNTALTFDPSRDVLDFGWVLGQYFTVSEQAGSVVVALSGNQQSYTLTGVGLDEMSIANVTAKDASALAVWQAAFEAAGPSAPADQVVAIDWHYGVHADIAFDPATQVLDFGWMLGGYFTVREHDGSVMIDIAGNDQSYMLTGVTLDEMSMADIRAHDASTLAVWQAAFDAAGGNGDPPPPAADEVVAIDWNYGVHADLAFDPATQVLDFGWMLGSYFTVSEHDGSVMIDIAGNDQSYMLTGVALDEMSMADIRAHDASTLAVWQAAFDASGMPDDGHGSEHILTIAFDYGSHVALAFDPSHQLLDFGWMLGSYFTVGEQDGSVVIDIPENHQSVTLTGVTLEAMSMANIMANDPSALTVWQEALGETGGGEEPLPDGGTLYAVATTGADIVGFDPMTDRLDLGENSVHAFIVVDTTDGVGFLNPWNDTLQLIQGVRLADLGIGNFAPVFNNHLREDLSGALAWEQGVTAAPLTVYARSHEYGKVDRVAFDPATDVVDFRYYGSREQLSMIQSDEGVLIDSGATGQKLILLGTTLDQLSGDNFVFHYAQVYEDHLDQQLGIAFDPANVLPRSFIADAGSAASPMGHVHDTDEHEHPDAVTTKIAWAWGTNTVLAFDPHEDYLDFGLFDPSEFTVADVDDDIVITLLGHQQTYVLENLHLDDLTIGNIIARDVETLEAWVGYLP